MVMQNSDVKAEEKVQYLFLRYFVSGEMNKRILGLISISKYLLSC